MLPTAKQNSSSVASHTCTTATLLSKFYKPQRHEYTEQHNEVSVITPWHCVSVVYKS
jgi:hypothetical protein